MGRLHDTNQGGKTMPILRCQLETGRSNIRPEIQNRKEVKKTLSNLLSKLKAVPLEILSPIIRKLTAPNEKKKSVEKLRHKKKIITRQTVSNRQSDDFADYFERKRAKLMNWEGYY